MMLYLANANTHLNRTLFNSMRPLRSDIALNYPLPSHAIHLLLTIPANGEPLTVLLET